MPETPDEKPIIVDYTFDEKGDVVLVVEGRRISNVTALSVKREVNEAARIEASFVLMRK